MKKVVLVGASLNSGNKGVNALTRGFGIIPGLVANLGIAGVISYILFIKNNLNICITKNNFFIFVIFIIYLTSIFSIWHIYTPIMIALVLFMNKTLIKEK